MDLSAAQGNLTRRLRRHIIGPTHSIYVVTTPGLETVCLSELKALRIGQQPSLVGKGLVLLSGRLTDLYQANLHLSTANRVLMQAGQFTAPNLGALRDKAVRFPWELYLGSQPGVILRVRSSRTPLFHSGAVAQQVEEAIAIRLTQHDLPAPALSDQRPLQMVLLRVQGATCSIFIDSSGDLLYRRGLKTHGGQAPLRESVAAAMLRLCDYRSQEVLLDPMCGSGTFALEAVMRADGIAPGWFRHFAFESWPAFRPATWQYLRRQAQWNTDALPKLKVHASDIEARAVDRLETSISKTPFAGAVNTHTADFFKLTPTQFSATNGVILINPPYGKRLQEKSSATDLYRRIGRKLTTDFTGWRLGLVVPDKQVLKALPFSGAVLGFSHGGDQRWILIAKI